MEAPRKDWIREVMMPWMVFGAIVGVALGALVMWAFAESFYRWHDYIFFPVVCAVLGSLVSWALTGLMGIFRFLRNK